MNFSKLILTMTLMSIATMAIAQHDTPTIWYQQPAREWMEGIPMGNGRLATIVYGGIDKDRIALNEISLWAGQPDSLQNDICGKEALAEMRECFFNGDIKKGNQLGDKYLYGRSASFGTHLPLGDMILDFEYPTGPLTDYRRELNLENATASVTFNKGGVSYSRKYICSYPDNVFVVKLDADKNEAINVKLSTELLRKAQLICNKDGIVLEGKVDYPMFGPGGVNFMGDIRIIPQGGNITYNDNSVTIKNANSLTIVTDIRTDYDTPDYKSLCKSTVDKAITQSFDNILDKHVADYSPLFNRMSIKLGNTPNNDLPTDTRLHLIKDGAVDPDFDALFFQYGRYMLLASSRPGTSLCANLQGIWNDNLACQMAWTCDYHLDINIEQNYWSANKANLAECNEPLFAYLRLLEKHGAKTAQKMYGCNGWVAHTVANAWGYTAPGWGVSWGMNVTGGAWLATHLWSHYRYTQDKEYLRNVGYPMLKSCAEFFVDYMVSDPNTGYLVTGPSVSPENGFHLNGESFSLSMMPTIDRAIVHDIYTACIESSKILNVDKKFRKRLEKDIKRLPPLQIGKDGQIKEWLLDVVRQEPNHRHSSHLLSLYPLAQISTTKTPELAKAAKISIEAQVNAPGWEDVEWSCANMLCFNAFLKDGERSHYWLQDLFRYFTRENLMTVSPKGIAGAPADIFSFDATEASVAGMCDMLLQSQDGFIEFLPALPKIWSEGELNGVCAEGALVADLKWASMKMTDAKITAQKDANFNILIPKGASPRFAINGTTVTPTIIDGMANITLKKGEYITLKF